MSASPFSHRARSRLLLGAALFSSALVMASSEALAAPQPQRTFYRLPSSNGHGAVMIDLQAARLVQFREHLFASEEPRLDANGMEMWINGEPASVLTRDLLWDAYFGVRANGNQKWLTALPVDFDASGYAGWAAGKQGGTGIITMVQRDGALEATQYFFAPRALPHSGFVMAARFKNTGTQTLTGVSAFSIHNFHLGYGRPPRTPEVGKVENGENGETIEYQGSVGKADFLERAFAGVVVARALGTPSHHGASPSANVYQIVNGGGTTNLPDLNGTAPTADGSVSAYQFDLGDLGPGQEKWVGVVFSHYGDPFAGATVQGFLDAYVAGKDAKTLVEAEIADWASFQSTLTVPQGLDANEEALLRQSAVMLEMAQVKESSSYAREFFDQDGVPRHTRFGVQLPGVIPHHGKGAVIASLPPGEWTIPWIRDGAYALTAMSALGMKNEARDGLLFYLNAESGRFQSWNELASYNMPPYQISLVRYYGFGVEETDFNNFGPNLEFDGFGLFLWALRHYELSSGDISLVDDNWSAITTRIADVLVALVDPSTGLLRPDSSIWETHWNGREREWAYTNITAVRGLCDAAALAERKGESSLAQKYKDSATSLRAAIASKLVDAQGALAANTKELAAGQGYFDAAVLDAIAMGLFDPKGKIATATLAALDQRLLTASTVGWSRNDDRNDHAGSTDLSPWGSEYDSAEWVVTDLRGAVATRLMGGGYATRSDNILAWVRDQSLANYLAVAETYEENNGTYKFNAPMVGFGAGVYALALFARSGPLDEPACGAYFDESSSSSSSSSGGMGGMSGAGGAPGTGSSTSGTFVTTSVGAGGNAGTGGNGTGGDEGGCGCRTAPRTGGGYAALAFSALAAALLGRRRGRRRRRTGVDSQRRVW